MQRKLLLSAMAATLIAAGGGAVLAQNAPPANAPQAQPAPTTTMGGQGRMGAMDHHHGMHGDMRGDMHKRMMSHRGGPVGAVIGDLRQIARLYMMAGKTRQLEALYKEVLGKTQNPMVRNYVYDAMARLQARPRDTEAAVATLRKSLNENLDRLNAMPERGPKR